MSSGESTFRSRDARLASVFKVLINGVFGLIAAPIALSSGLESWLVAALALALAGWTGVVVRERWSTKVVVADGVLTSTVAGRPEWFIPVTDVLAVGVRLGVPPKPLDTLSANGSEVPVVALEARDGSTTDMPALGFSKYHDLDDPHSRPQELARGLASFLGVPCRDFR